MEDCINCGMSLSGGDLTLPWEDGDNPNAYIICPHCRTKNTVYGYGEDDDYRQWNTVCQIIFPP